MKDFLISLATSAGVFIVGTTVVVSYIKNVGSKAGKWLAHIMPDELESSLKEFLESMSDELAEAKEPSQVQKVIEKVSTEAKKIVEKKL